MRRHSAVLDEGSAPAFSQGTSPPSNINYKRQRKKDGGLICVVDPDTGLRRVTESRANVAAGDEGRIRRVAATLRDGLGFKR